MNEQIISYAKKIGIDMIGFSNSKRDDDLIRRHKLKFDLHYDVPFNNDYKGIDNLAKILPSVTTIITVALPYYKTCSKLENLSDDEVYFSSSSWGEDYHTVLNDKLDELINFLKGFYPDLEFEKCVDVKPVDDRYLAHKAGIGFFGKNGLIINPKHGSYIFIGSLLTNLDLEPSKIIDSNCGNCTLCMDNCPGKAIKKDGINSRLCLSYLTQKKELNGMEKERLNQCIYGCDRCMQVCPYNKGKKDGYYKFKPTGIEFINVLEYQDLSNSEFKEKYGHLSGSWRGKRIIERNIKNYKEKIDNKRSMC